MLETSLSLLERIRTAPDSQSWNRLVELYAPFIAGWLRRQGLQAADVDDLVQDVLGVLMKELPQFRYEKSRGSFRSWLRAITRNRLLNFWRSRRVDAAAAGVADSILNQLADPASSLSQLWDVEHDQHVAARLLQLLEPDFEPTTWQAFRRVVIDGQKTSAVAVELGMTANAVCIAKHRVLRRLRQELQGLVD